MCNKTNYTVAGVTVEPGFGDHEGVVWLRRLGGLGLVEVLREATSEQSTPGPGTF